jgi:hypothetical protein
MPKIIVRADETQNNRADITLTERIVAAHLNDRHYARQLVERLSWAAADAEALESDFAVPAPDAIGSLRTHAADLDQIGQSLPRDSVRPGQAGWGALRFGIRVGAKALMER